MYGLTDDQMLEVFYAVAYDRSKKKIEAYAEINDIKLSKPELEDAATSLAADMTDNPFYDSDGPEELIRNIKENFQPWNGRTN